VKSANALYFARQAQALAGDERRRLDASWLVTSNIRLYHSSRFEHAQEFPLFLQSRGPAGAQGGSEGTALLDAFNHTAFHYGSRLMM
jgi:hypothetical protein